jgi:hypothetical protein
VRALALREGRHEWIRQMTPILLEMCALIAVVIAIESWLFWQG